MKNTDIVDKAREYLGTPYRHQGRHKKFGVDCLGLIICVARDLVKYDKDFTGYGKLPTGVLHKTIRQECEPTDLDIPGVILEMRWRHEPQHLAIRTENGIIHSYNGGPRKVTEHCIDEQWQRMISGRYLMPGVDYGA